MRALRLVGHVGEAEPGGRRRRRPHRRAVLRDHPADAGDQPGRARLRRAAPRPSWRAPGSCSCRADRPPNVMPPVTVSGRSDARPELVGLHLHRRREAAVQVDVIGVAAGSMPVSSATASRPALTAGRPVEFAASRHRHHVVRLDGGEREHPPVLAATPERSAASAEHSTNAGGLVDVPLRAVPSWCTAPRASGSCADGADRNSGVHRVAPPRVGIGRGDALNPAHSSAAARVRLATVSPGAARNAVSIIEYCSGRGS